MEEVSDFYTIVLAQLNTLPKLLNIQVVRMFFIRGFSLKIFFSSFNFGRDINLNEFRKLRYKTSFYEPEVFCGLNYKRGNRLTALIFWTGKIVITGAKNLEEIEEMYYHLLPYLKISQK